MEGSYYKIHGKKYPRVTAILSARPNPYLDRWRENMGAENAKLISHEAMNKGTLIHQLVERLSSGNPILETEWAELEEGVRNACRAFVRFQIAEGFQKIASEKLVWSDEWKYAGTLDSYGVVRGGMRAIADWKSSKSIWSDYRIQIAAYHVALGERLPGLPVDVLWIVRLDQLTGNYEICEVRPGEEVETLFNKFLEAYSMWERKNPGW